MSLIGALNVDEKHIMCVWKIVVSPNFGGMNLNEVIIWGQNVILPYNYIGIANI